MTDKEVGELWCNLNEWNGTAATVRDTVRNLIRKLVEERVDKYQARHPDVPRRDHEGTASRDFGIDPETWK